MNESKQWPTLLQTFEQALSRFCEILTHSLTETDFVLDASIQRFEFCFELFWKLLKRVLWEEEKIDAPSPRQVLKQAYQLNWIDDETLWLQMAEDRNLMAHTYRELDAHQVYQRLPAYAVAFQRVHAILKTKRTDDCDPL